jgi:hypothetical protein
VLNAGLRQIDSSDAVTGRSVIKVKGKQATEPVPLDRSGKPLSATATPVWLTFNVYYEISFTDTFQFTGI